MADGAASGFEAERALHESEARLRAILETAVDGIVTINERGIIEMVNAAMTRIFGYSAEEMVGQNVSLLMAPPHREQHDAYMRQYCLTGQRTIIGIGREVPGRRKNGSIIPLDLAVSEVMIGKRRTFTGIVRDITDLKKAQTELLVAKEAAEAASKAKDHFMAVLSHELRTPLTPLLTAVELLQMDGSLSEDSAEIVQMMRRNIEMETRLIDDLLDLTRVSRGKLELQMGLVDLHERLNYAIEICQSEMRSKQLLLRTSLEARRHHVRGDGVRLQQVMWNLLKNAVKFTPRGGTITIRTFNIEQDRVAVTISDTGVGIEPENISRLFNPFEQGGREVTRQFGGLGLGLAITKELVERHGGRLTAQSEGRDKGSTFTVELPTVDDARAEDRTPPNPAEHTSGQGRRVLLVEDHADSARAMAHLLKERGFRVRIADCLMTAMQSAAAEPFDLLITDINLPDGSGLDLMRQLSARRPVKGIVVSGFGMEDDIRRSRDAGFSIHLTKPITISQLEQAITQVLAPA